MENHIISIFNQRAMQYGQKEAFRFRNSGKNYQSITWEQLKTTVDQVFEALQHLGCGKGDKIGIFSANRPQWMISDLGIMAACGVVVPLYATASQEQIKYIANETQMKLLFAGNQQQLDTALALMEQVPSLEKIVVFEPFQGDDPRVIAWADFLEIPTGNKAKVTDGPKSINYDPEDLATIIYTSGTTGEPKGAMLKHDNFVYCFQIHDERLNVNNKDVSLCFLPLSHVFERLWSHYLLYKGAVNVFLENPREVIEVLPVVKPTLMCTVPRFFDKTYQGIHAELSRWPAVKQKIFKWAVKTGLQAIEYRCRAQKLPFSLGLKLNLADKLVLKKLRGIFGGNIKTMPCSGAAISTEVLKFFHAAGVFINYGYGATETTATVSCFRSDRYFYGTCGTIMPGVEVKIGEKNEILVKGRSVFAGYYKKEEATREVLKEGWFYTGDEGYTDDMDNLVMTDRIKDLMKTSVGKYVSPQKLELLLAQDELVEQIIVVGDNRQYVTALIVPSMPKLQALAQEHQISAMDDRALTQSYQILEIMEKRFAELQKELTSYERVVRFTLLPEPFSIESGTMTSTLKLRRRSIEKAYKSIIDEMYI